MSDGVEAASDTDTNGKDRFPCLIHARDIKGLKSRTQRLESGMLEVLAESSASRSASEEAKVESKATKEIATKVFDLVGEVRGDFREYQKSNRQSCHAIHDGVSDRLRNLEAKALNPEDTGSGVLHISEPELLAAKYDAKSREMAALTERLSTMESAVKAMGEEKRAAMKAAKDSEALQMSTQAQLKSARYGMLGAVGAAVIAGGFGITVLVIQLMYGG